MATEYVGGKLGDVSGLGGKLGDVSGDETFEEIVNLLLQDQNVESLECLENKIKRLRAEFLSIARWLDIRIRVLGRDLKTAQEDIAEHEERITDLEPDEEGSDEPDEGNAKRRRRRRVARK
jgi:hypothetical protein